MGVPLYIVDAFAERPFAGNPAAVCLLEEVAEESWMQSVAAEMNLSETAFLVQQGSNAYALRWFTPLMEVDLCGHATLASAHVLSETGRVEEGASVEFSTRSGVLGVTARDGWIRMDFPSDPPRSETTPGALAEALGTEVEWFGRSRHYEFARVASASAVRETEPDFRGLADLVSVGICVTAAGDSPDHDFVSRFFAPSAGFDEDPVTGSAHCQLAPYWAERLGKTRMVGRQLSPRGGTVRVAMDGDRVAIDGRAVTVLRGELAVPD